MVEGVGVKTGVGSFTVLKEPIEKMFALAPERFFFHSRDAIGSMFGSHRREWMQRTLLKKRPRGLLWKVLPKSKKLPPGGTLDLIEGEAFSTSRVHLGQEKGGVQRPRRGQLLAIPIGVSLTKGGRVKRGRATPRKFRRTQRGELLALTGRTTGKTILYVKKGTGDNAELQPAYVLLPQVRHRPVLRFMHTWDALAPDRLRRMKRALDRTVADMARGKP